MRKTLFILSFTILILALPWFILSWMVRGELYRDVAKIPEREY